LDVSADAYARLHATLPPDERSRSARFRFQADRRRFVVARAVLRDLLARHLEIEPAVIRFAYNAFGKPALTPEFGGRVRFNLSHSAHLALIAIATDVDVGVDVEWIRADPDQAEIARHFFSEAEVARLNALPRQLKAEEFFRCWTRREACVKARGQGLGDDPIELPDDSSVQIVHPAPGYIGAVATA
jgi:4'-phosphopantetheinyl transferase